MLKNVNPPFFIFNHQQPKKTHKVYHGRVKPSPTPIKGRGRRENPQFPCLKSSLKNSFSLEPKKKKRVVFNLKKTNKKVHKSIHRLLTPYHPL